MFARSGVVAVDQLFDNVGLLWSEGRMVGVSGLIRFSLEYWAAVHFGYCILDAMKSGTDIDEVGRKTARLTFSAKTPVKLPWGGTTTNLAYNVLTFIDNLNKSEPLARPMYDFLCEASHPNFLQNSYFIMASRRYSNFSNESFKTHAHELLEKCVGTMEMTAAGISKNLMQVNGLTLPMMPTA